MDQLSNISSQEEFNQKFLNLYNFASAEEKAELENEIISNRSLIEYSLNSNVEFSDEFKGKIVQFFRMQDEKFIDIEVEDSKIVFSLNSNFVSIAELNQNENVLAVLPGEINKNHILSNLLFSDILNSFDSWYKNGHVNSPISGKVKEDGTFTPEKKSPLNFIDKGTLKVKKPGSLSPSAVKSLISGEIDGNLQLNFSKNSAQLTFEVDYETWSSLALSGVGQKNADLMKKVMLATGVASVVLFSNPANASDKNTQENTNTVAVEQLLTSPNNNMIFGMLTTAATSVNGQITTLLNYESLGAPANFINELKQLRNITKKLNNLDRYDTIEDFIKLGNKYNSKVEELVSMVDAMGPKANIVWNKMTLRERVLQMKYQIDQGNEDVSYIAKQLASAQK